MLPPFLNGAFWRMRYLSRLAVDRDRRVGQPCSHLFRKALTQCLHEAGMAEWIALAAATRADRGSIPCSGTRLLTEPHTPYMCMCISMYTYRLQPNGQGDRDGLCSNAPSGACSLLSFAIFAIPGYHAIGQVESHRTQHLKCTGQQRWALPLFAFSAFRHKCFF